MCVYACVYACECVCVYSLCVHWGLSTGFGAHMGGVVQEFLGSDAASVA